MPLLPVVRSPPVPRQRTSPQVAGALIPDNTQHSWRDDVGALVRETVDGSDVGKAAAKQHGRDFGSAMTDRNVSEPACCRILQP